MTAVGTPQNDQNLESSISSMKPPKKVRTKLIRPAIDALAAFALFSFIALTWTCAPSSASPNIPRTGAYLHFAPTSSAPMASAVAVAPTAVKFQPGNIAPTVAQPVSWGLLGVAFSILAALNLAMVRHLRHAYAVPRRRNFQP